MIRNVLETLFQMVAVAWPRSGRRTSNKGHRSGTEAQAEWPHFKIKRKQAVLLCKSLCVNPNRLILMTPAETIDCSASTGSMAELLTSTCSPRAGLPHPGSAGCETAACLRGGVREEKVRKMVHKKRKSERWFFTGS